MLGFQADSKSNISRTFDHGISLYTQNKLPTSLLSMVEKTEDELGV